MHYTLLLRKKKKPAVFFESSVADPAVASGTLLASAPLLSVTINTSHYKKQIQHIKCHAMTCLCVRDSNTSALWKTTKHIIIKLSSPPGGTIIQFYDTKHVMLKGNHLKLTRWDIKDAPQRPCNATILARTVTIAI